MYFFTERGWGSRGNVGWKKSPLKTHKWTTETQLPAGWVCGLGAGIMSVSCSYLWVQRICGFGGGRPWCHRVPSLYCTARLWRASWGHREPCTQPVPLKPSSSGPVGWVLARSGSEGTESSLRALVRLCPRGRQRPGHRPTCLQPPFIPAGPGPRMTIKRF